MRRSLVARRAAGAAAGGALLLPATACKSDQGLADTSLDRVAVVAGDFDQVEEALSRLLVYHAVYEGYIAGPVYDLELDPDTNALAVETLLTGVDAEGEAELSQHDALFVNSGVRGLGDVTYAGLEPDDALLADPAAVAALVAWVEAGHSLLASDWAYDLVEAGWPERLDPFGEDDQPDAAQVGVSELVVAEVVDPAMQEALGGGTVQLSFDYSRWVVLEGVSSEVTVHLRGDVQLRPDDETGTVSLPDVPLLVSFGAGSGRVVLSAFHWRAQRAVVADALLPLALPGLAIGGAADTGLP